MKEPIRAIEEWQVLPVSAGSAEDLKASLTQLSRRLDDAELSLDDIAFSLQEERSVLARRSAVVCRSKDEAKTALERLLTSAPQSAIEQVRPVFLFPGQGAQYPDMLRGLYESIRSFRTEIDDCLRLFSEIDGIELQPLKEALFPPPDQRAGAARFLAQTRYAQPLLFIIELSLARLWISYGVAPQALLGHSIGEYTAASLAGVFSWEDGLRLVAARGRLMQSMPAGGMLAVNLTSTKTQELLTDGICLAGDNSPGQSVLSGPHPALKKLAEDLGRRGIFCQQLTTSHAFHSGMMDPILDEFLTLVSRVTLKPPIVPIVSCRTGTWLTESEATDPVYWVRQLRETVRFRTGIETLLTTKHPLLLEVGPGRALSTQSQKIIAGTGTRVFSSARRDAEKLDDREVFLSTLATLWTMGVNIRWAELGRAKERAVPISSQASERQLDEVEASSQAGHDKAPQGTGISGQLVLAIQWTASSLPLPDASKAPNGGCMIFSDAVGLGSALAERLRMSGQTCILAHLGDGFRRLSDTECIVPRAPDTLSRLLTKARQGGRLCRIIHCSSIGADEPSLQSTILPDLRLLAQTLEADRTPLELFILSEGSASLCAGEASSPLQSLLSGPVLVTLRSSPWVSTRFIEVDSEDREIAAQQVQAELSDERGDKVVAYRRRCRWTGGFQSMDTEKTESRRRVKGSI